MEWREAFSSLVNSAESAVQLKAFFLDSISPRLKKLAVWTAAVFVFYTVLGFFLLPPIVRVVAVKQLSKHLDRPVTIQKVRLNPYTLSATIRGLLIADKDGAPLASWKEVYVNFQLSSLFGRAWVFKEVNLSRPFVRIRINKDSTLNFSDIVARIAPAWKPSTTGGRGCPWRISRVHVSDGRASFTDLIPRMPFKRMIGPLELALTNFRTGSANSNHYALSGVTDAGEQFSSKGFFHLDPFGCDGDVLIDGISVTKYAPLYQDLSRLEFTEGIMTIHATCRYERGAATRLLTVTNTALALKALKVVEKDTGKTVAAVSNAFVSGVSADVFARRVDAGTFTIADGRFMCGTSDTSIKAIESSTPREAAASAQGGIVLLLRGITNVVARLLRSTNVVSAKVGDFNMTNCTVRLEDSVNSKPVRLDFDGIAVHAKNLSNRAGTNMTAQVSLRWDTNGAVQADIRAALSPASAEVKLAFDDLNLPPLGPWLEPRLAVLVLGGNLGLAGTLGLRSANGELPDIRFQGDASLDGLLLAEAFASERLLQWKSLRISGIEARLNPPTLSATTATVEGMAAQLIIETNRTFNLMTALHPGGASTAAAQSAKESAAVGPKVSLASMVLSNAEVHFIDRSIRPNVNITLEQLNGTLSGLSSEDPTRAHLHFQGAVGQSARAEITGEINPWNSQQPVDLALSLQQVSLLPADPYSARYLGYQLIKGELSAQLTYQVSERKLQSENRVMLDQLTLGEKVESPEAIKWPVRLAIAILKDRDGRIELNLPIDGSLDDPQFNLGKLAFGAVETALTHIVTSPFAVLGALFGGNGGNGAKGEELSFQDFQPGSTNLLPAAIAKLDVLANALYARPGLQLEIEGSADPLTDLEPLRRQKLNEQLAAQARNAPLFSGQTNAAASDLAAIEPPPARSSWRSWSSEKGATALTSRVTRSPHLETKSGIKEGPRSHQRFPGNKGVPALMPVAAPEEAASPSGSEDQRLDGAQIAPDALRTLAIERARNVRAYLLQTGKVEAQRITESAQGVSSKGARVYVRLQ